MPLDDLLTTDLADHPAVATGATPDLGGLLAQRYGLLHAEADPDTARALAALPAPGGPAEAVLHTLLAHRSVRAFEPAALPAGTLELLVAAAQSAPTSSNLQALSIVAVQDAGTRDALAACCGQQQQVRQAPLFLCWVADLSRLDRVAAARGEAADANRYLEQLLVAGIDAALAAQNLVTAAEALGLGTVYIGALRNQAHQVARLLALPPRAIALFGLCVGRPDPDQPGAVKPRLPQALVLHQERYRPTEGTATLAEAAAVAGYDAALLQFQQQQALPPVPWSRQASQRVRGPESLSGRHRLAEHLRDQGFELR